MGNLLEVRALSDHLWHGDFTLVLGDVCALDKQVHRITETTPSPSQETESVFSFFFNSRKRLLFNSAI